MSTSGVVRALAPALMLVFVINSAEAQASSPTFADIPWGSSVATARAQLVSKGFTPEPLDEDGDMPFEGELARWSVTGWVQFADGAAARVLLLMRADPTEVWDVYDLLRRQLTRKYGPGRSMSSYEWPYDSDDPRGQLETAIAVGKAQVAHHWGPEDGPLQISITRNRFVALSYFSPAWDAEVARRQAASTDAL